MPGPTHTSSYQADVPLGSTPTEELYTEDEMKEDYIEIPLIRGFDVISYLWQKLCNFDCFIAGGYARYCASPQMYPAFSHDIDIFSETKRAYSAFRDVLKSELVVQEDSIYALKFVVPEKGPWHYMPKIHLIKPNPLYFITIGTKTEVLDHFDFSICRAAIESPNTVLVHKHFLKDESKKILRIETIPDPVRTAIRAIKYAQKGYYLPPGEVMKLFDYWQSLSDIEKNTVKELLFKPSK